MEGNPGMGIYKIYYIMIISLKIISGKGVKTRMDDTETKSALKKAEI